MEKNMNLAGMWHRFNHTSYPFFVNRFTNNSVSSSELSHFHDYAQIFYLLSGKYRHRIGETVYEGGPGSMMIVPPGFTHFYEITEDCECEFIMVCIMPSFFDRPTINSQLHTIVHTHFPEFSHEIGFTPKICVTLEGEERRNAENILLELSRHNWLCSINNFSALRTQLCNLFLSDTFALSDSALKKATRFYTQKYEPIMKTVYHMNINYNKIIHRDELIAMSNICQTDYFKLIKRIIGCTYSTYMQMIRVRRAIEMCTFSTYSLSYIADICGFGDLAYMEKRIKKFHPKAQLPNEMKKKRGQYVKSWPFSIKSRSEYENISKHFYAYGL